MRVGVVTEGGLDAIDMEKVVRYTDQVLSGFNEQVTIVTDRETARSLSESTVIANNGNVRTVETAKVLVADYLLAFSSGVDCKAAGDTLATEMRLTGKIAKVWNSSSADIKHSVNVGNL